MTVACGRELGTVMCFILKIILKNVATIDLLETDEKYGVQEWLEYNGDNASAKLNVESNYGHIYASWKLSLLEGFGHYHLKLVFCIEIINININCAYLAHRSIKHLPSEPSSTRHKNQWSSGIAQTLIFHYLTVVIPNTSNHSSLTVLLWVYSPCCTLYLLGWQLKWWE